MPDPAAELARCRRYCQVSGTGAGDVFGAGGVFGSAAQAWIHVEHPGMRATPALSWSAPGDFQVYNGANSAVSALSAGLNGPGRTLVNLFNNIEDLLRG